MDKDSFLNYVKSKNIYIDTAKTVKTRFDTSNYEIEHYHRKKQKSCQINER